MVVASTIAGADIMHDRIRPDVKKISEPEKSATVTLNTPPSQIVEHSASMV